MNEEKRQLILQQRIQDHGFYCEVLSNNRLLIKSNDNNNIETIETIMSNSDIVNNWLNIK